MLHGGRSAAGLVQDLRPATSYLIRARATNEVGTSGWCAPSLGTPIPREALLKTKQAPPKALGIAPTIVRLEKYKVTLQYLGGP